MANIAELMLIVVRKIRKDTLSHAKVIPKEIIYLEIEILKYSNPGVSLVTCYYT